MKSTLFLFLLLVFPFFLHAQVPGTLDPSFPIQTNYGFNRMPEHPAMGPDGSTYFYAPTALFSGKRAGSLFKILPNGLMDSSFISPDFHFFYGPFCGVGGVSNPEVRFLPVADGSVYCQTISTLHTGDSIYNTPVRFLPNGSIDLHFQHSEFKRNWVPLYISSTGASFGRQFIGNSGFPTGSRIRRFLANGDLDPTFSFPDTSYYEMYSPVENSRGEVVFLMKKSGESHGHFRKYFPGASTLSEPFGAVPQAELHIYPYLLGLTHAGEIIENNRIYGSPLGYRTIRKRKPDGTLDPAFQSFIARNGHFTSDSLGNLTLVRKQGGDTLQILRYFATGAFRDSSVHVAPFWFVQQDTLVLAGPFEENRWTYIRKGFQNQVYLKRKTRFGFNAPTNRLMAAENGKIWVAGQFSHYNDFQSPGLVRLLPNGNPDPDFVCQAFPGGISSQIVYLDQFSNGDILLVSNRKEGPQQRYLHRIRPDGTVDLTFWDLPDIGINLNYRHITAAKFEADGNFWFGLGGWMQPGSIYRSYLIRVQANGALDPSFTPLQPVTTQNDQGYIRDIYRIDSVRILLELPISKNAPSGYYSYLSVGMLTLDPTEGDTFQIVKRTEDYTETGKWLPSTEHFLLSGEQQCASYQLNGEVDSSFTPMHWTGQALQAKINPRVVLNGGEILASTVIPRASNGFYAGHQRQHLLKTNPFGVVDTAFVSSFLNGRIAQTLETDSLGFYLAGDLVQFGNQQVNYLVRVSNRPGQIQVSSKPAQSRSFARLYPNPTKDLLWVSGAPAGANLTFYNAQGRILFSGSGHSPISTHFWPGGVYFWRMEQQGNLVESGRVVKH